LALLQLHIDITASLYVLTLLQVNIDINDKNISNFGRGLLSLIAKNVHSVLENTKYILVDSGVSMLIMNEADYNI
jgi:hypothetical protein